MQTQTRLRMTSDDIALLRQIVTWRRSAGITYIGGCRLYVAPSGGSIAWTHLGNEDNPEIGVCACRTDLFEWHRVHSLTEAVDLLVALGYLPDRFSSQYRAGYAAAMSNWTYPADDPTAPETTA